MVDLIISSIVSLGSLKYIYNINNEINNQKATLQTIHNGTIYTPSGIMQKLKED